MISISRTYLKKGSAEILTLFFSTLVGATARNALERYFQKR